MEEEEDDMMVGDEDFGGSDGKERMEKMRIRVLGILQNCPIL